MNILVVTEYYPVVYKPYYDTQFAALLEQGHDVRIWAARPLDAVRNEKVQRYGLESRTRYYPATLRDIVRTANNVAGPVLRHPRAAWTSARASDRGTWRYRLVAALRQMCVFDPTADLCIVHGLGAAVQFPGLRRMYPDIPLALYFHGGEVPHTGQWSRQATSDAFGMFDVVFTNTEFSRARTIERGCPSSKVRVLPVGFDLGDYPLDSSRRYRVGGELRLMSAGRMSEEKGLHFALEAVARLVDAGHDNIRYDLAGDGYCRPALEEMVKSQRLQRHVRFLGPLTTDSLIRKLARVDALLLPSMTLGPWSETQACAVQEAMLSGAAVITARTGGVPESIPPAMAEFVHDEGDIEGIMTAIRRLSHLSTSRLEALGVAGRNFVTQNYEINKLNQRMLRDTLAAHSGTPTGIDADGVGPLCSVQ